MRYVLTDHEWAAIRPMLPNKPRGVPRVNDRRVLNGIFWVLGSGAPWRDLPDIFGPYTTCYNRFVRGEKYIQTVKHDPKGACGAFTRQEWECEIAGDEPDLDLTKDTALAQFNLKKLRRKLRPGIRNRS
jgi:transposase